MSKDIAVISMNGRFPKADKVEEFWDHLMQGMDCIERKDPVVTDTGVNRKTVNAKGIINDIYDFDFSYFGISEYDAKLLDPQHRIFLQGCSELFDLAGYNLDRLDKKVSVYASAAPSTYLNSENFESPEEKMRVMIANTPDFIATKTSYYLNLNGESITVQTACSSSLAALHLACESLQKGNCDLAVAGGINIVVPQDVEYKWQKGMMHSSSGYCKPFSKDADGIVESSGFGVVLLKRLEDAKKDCDTIYAVIKGSAMNNDGKDKIGYTAPSIDGQRKVIEEAFADAQLKSAEQIGYVETHGTGTELGDSIEIESMGEFFKDVKNPVAIGSVKSNIGHTIRASGIIGFIKSVLVAYNGVIPATLYCEQENEDIAESGNLTLVKKATKFDIEKYIITNSFGFGGTNVSVILRPYREQELEKESAADVPRILLLSARTEKELQTYKENLRLLLEESKCNLSDLEFTFAIGKKEFTYRYACIFQSVKELISMLGAAQMIEEYEFNGIANDSEGRKEIVLRDRNTDCMCKALAAWTKGANIKFSGFLDGMRRPFLVYPYHNKYCNYFDQEEKEQNRNTETLEDAFIQCLKELLESDKEIYMEDDLFELGFDSLLFINFVDRCGNMFSVELDFDDFVDAEKVKDLYDILKKELDNKK